MAFDDLNQAQQDFIRNYFKSGPFKGSRNKKIVEGYEGYLAADLAYQEVTNRIPPFSEGKADVVSRYTEVLKLRDKPDFKKATALLVQMKTDMEAVEQRIKDTRERLGLEAGRIALPEGGTPAQQKFYRDALGRLQDALKPALPTPDQFDTVALEMDRMRQAVDQVGKLKDLAQRNPDVANSANAALDQMRSVTGGGDITPKRIGEAGIRVTQAELAVNKADLDLQMAQLMPQDTPDAIAARTEAIEKATEDQRKAKEEIDAAKALQKALLGTKLLTEALETGPLSGNGRKMPKDVQEALVAGFQSDPQLASRAVSVAATAKNPLAVANAIPGMAAQIDRGFKDKTGKGLPEGMNGRDYAAQVLEMGGTCGAEYFARFDSYINEGGLQKTDVLPDSEGDSLSEKSLKRANALAGHLLGSGGELKFDTSEAQIATGNLLFHPEALANSTPALNAHIVKTLTELGTEPAKTRAEGVLGGATAPSNAGAKQLVKSYVGDKSTYSEQDTRHAVLASMLQSVDQGPVGSCFATAPARRIRETDPVGAMEKYTQLANHGTLTTAKGVVIPVITNLPPGEDPLIRGFEYTLATAMGRDASMSVMTKNKNGVNKAAYEFMQEMRGQIDPNDATTGTNAGFRAILDEFTVTYDPTIDNPEVASDGSSSKGRYVFKAKDGTVIADRAAYRAKIIELFLDGFNTDETTDLGKEVIKQVDAKYMAEFDALLTTDPPGNPPWRLQSGGIFAESLETVYGTTDETATTAKNVGKSDTPEKIGTRTVEVLTGLIGEFGTTPPDMLMCQTPGVHGFNILPKDPSMAKLLEGSGTVSEKITRGLIEPGQALKDRAIGASEAARIFDASVSWIADVFEREIANPEKDENQRTRLREMYEDHKKTRDRLRPTEAKTPPQISQLCVDAGKDYFDENVIREDAKAKLATELADPQIVLADTNWGDPTNHTFFVIAPDPVSGHPALWQRTDPPGSMTLAPSEDWIDREWRVMKPRGS